MSKKVNTLFGLQTNVKLHTGDKEKQKEAKEDLRVFCYKQKPAFTASGHVIRR